MAQPNENNRSLEEMKFGLDASRLIIEFVGMAAALFALFLSIYTQIDAEEQRKKERAEESRPVLAVNTSQVPGDKFACEIVNVGKGIATNIHVTWVRADGTRLDQRTNPRHCLPGSTVKLEAYPPAVRDVSEPIDDLFYSRKANGQLLIYTTSVDGTRMFTQQEYTAYFNESIFSSIYFRFDGFVINPVKLN